LRVRQGKGSIPPEKKETSVAEVKVMSTGAVEPMVKLFASIFERESGHTANLNFSTAGGLRARLDAGEAADLIVLPAANMEAMDKAGMLVPGSRTDLGRTVTGIAIKDSAPAPDVSTPEAFKQALLKARGVSFSDPAAGGSSGTYFAGLLRKLGIADAIEKKAVLGKRGYEVAQAVVDGRAEIGTTFISELLTVPGVRILGPLPGDLYFANTYTAGIPAESGQRDAAFALLRMMTNPAMRSRWIEAGLEPAFPDR
jgi:molybdate transport system substrate-binding protein